MAKTRAALTRKLGVLKSRFTSRPAHQRGRTTMAQQKEKSSASSKKTPQRKKSSGSTGSKVARKTKKVLGDMLAGAAVGAVKGAVEAIQPEEQQGKKASK